MFKNLVVLGKSIQFSEIGELVTNNKILMIDYDETWSSIGIWITPEKYDEMVNDIDNFDKDCIINPIIVHNGEKVVIPKGKYEIQMINKIK